MLRNNNIFMYVNEKKKKRKTRLHFNVIINYNIIIYTNISTIMDIQLNIFNKFFRDLIHNY